MTTEQKPKDREVFNATEPWVLKELMDTERRIEKAFHEQTQYLSQKMENQTRWMMGLMITMTIAIVMAVLIQPMLD